MASEFSVASRIVSWNRKKVVVELRRHDSKVCSLLKRICLVDLSLGNCVRIKQEKASIRIYPHNISNGESIPK